MQWMWCGFLMLSASLVAADTVVATKTLRAKSIVTSADVRVVNEDVGGAATKLEAVLGAELKRAVYAGRPVLLSNITKPALVERNQLVRAEFLRYGILIETDARALERGAAGDVIEAINISSRKTIQATVTPEGRIRVLN